MRGLYLALFVLSLCISWLFFYRKNEWNQFLYFFVAVCLISFSTFRIGEAFPDYPNYVDYYQRILKGETVWVEYSFVLITYVASFLFDNVIGIFFIYALLGVFLKLYAIRQLSKLCFLSILIYIANTFLVQDLIQIRAGIAAGILLLCIKPIYERKCKKFIILTITAMFFHMSAVTILPLWFLNSKKINVYLWSIPIPLGYILAMLHINIFIIPIPFLQNKIELYLSVSDNEEINLFSALFILKYFISLFLLYFSSVLQRYNKYVYLLLKVYILSLFFFLIFSSTPTISFRLQGLYEVVDIILFPCMIYAFKPWSWAKLIPLSLACVYIYMLVFHSKLIFF